MFEWKYLISQFRHNQALEVLKGKLVISNYSMKSTSDLIYMLLEPYRKNLRALYWDCKVWVGYVDLIFRWVRETDRCIWLVKNSRGILNQIMTETISDPLLCTVRKFRLLGRGRLKKLKLFLLNRKFYLNAIYIFPRWRSSKWEKKVQITF